MPVVISVLIFILYYIIDSGATRVAKSGEMNIILGTWMSSLVLAPMGIFLTYKSNKDSVVFNIDVYKAFFRKIFGLRQSRHIFRKEVIIYSPDYQKICEKLDKICQECENYSSTHKLLGPPNYYKVFTNHTHDDHIKGISQEIKIVNMTQLYNKTLTQKKRFIDNFLPQKEPEISSEYKVDFIIYNKKNNQITNEEVLTAYIKIGGLKNTPRNRKVVGLSYVFHPNYELILKEDKGEQ